MMNDKYFLHQYFDKSKSDEIVGDIRNGMRYEDIEKKYYISYLQQSIYRWNKENPANKITNENRNVIKKTPLIYFLSNDVSEEVSKEIAEKLKQGQSSKKLEEEYNIKNIRTKVTTWNNLCKSNNKEDLQVYTNYKKIITLKTYGMSKEDLVKFIEENKYRFNNIKDFAKSLNASEQSLSNFIKTNFDEEFYKSLLKYKRNNREDL